MFEAEKLSKQAGFQIDVIGWYHSHPNITVFPS
jgi:proteasome lid subunit RPN8/RPN11